MGMGIRFGARQAGRMALVASGAAVGTLAAEVWVATRHRFLPASQPHEIDCVLGPEDGEPLVLAVLGDSSVAGVGADSAETSRAFRWPLRNVLGTWARAYTRLYKAELEHHGITVLDIAKVTRAAFHRRPEMFSDDWFHPSSTGYTFLGTLYGAAARDALDNARAATPEPPEAAA